MSGAEQTRESWRYPGDKLNRNLLGRAEGLAPPTPHRNASPRSCLDIVVVTFLARYSYILVLANIATTTITYLYNNNYLSRLLNKLHAGEDTKLPRVQYFNKTSLQTD